MLNNRGFAISGIIYSVLILFLIILTGFLTMLASRKVILDKIKKEVITTIESKR